MTKRNADIINRFNTIRTKKYDSHKINYYCTEPVILPVSKITPEEIIDFSTSISKEKLVIACGNNINELMKF